MVFFFKIPRNREIRAICLFHKFILWLDFDKIVSATIKKKEKIIRWIKMFRQKIEKNIIFWFADRINTQCYNEDDQKTARYVKVIEKGKSFFHKRIQSLWWLFYDILATIFYRYFTIFTFSRSYIKMRTLFVILAICFAMIPLIMGCKPPGLLVSNLSTITIKF